MCSSGGAGALGSNFVEPLVRQGARSVRVIDRDRVEEHNVGTQDTARALGLPCVHAGLNADYGEVVWDEHYRVPRGVAGPAACDYPLARNLVLLTVAVAPECVLGFALGGLRRQWSITLGDFAIRAIETG